MKFKFWTESLDPDSCIAVDGGMPGKLHLSHWPGNRTPEELKTDMSTGMCLKLNASPDREKYLEGISTVTNNHYDTDGVMSAFTILNPEFADENAQLLLEAAVAGDFDAYTTGRGTAIDLTLTALTKHPDSKVKSTTEGDEPAQRQAQYEAAFELIPALLDNPYNVGAWFQPELRQIESDLRAFREDEIELERLDALDLAVIRAERINRKAANTIANCDRILILTDDEVSFRISTRSWFELVSIPQIPRPPLSLLVQKLEQATGIRWNAGSETDPSPEVRPEGHPEHNVVKNVVTQFLSSYPVLPIGL